MTHAEPTTIDVWSSLADLLANLIAKYEPVLDLDETDTPVHDIPIPQGSPKPGASLSYNENMSIAA